MKIRCTELRDWSNFITLMYENTLKTSTVDKTIDENEGKDFLKNCNQNLDERKEILKENQFTVEDVFDDIKSKYCLSPEQTPK